MIFFFTVYGFSNLFLILQLTTSFLAMRLIKLVNGFFCFQEDTSAFRKREKWEKKLPLHLLALKGG